MNKIWIISWHTSDLYITHLLPKDIDRVFVLENRWWDLHTLDIKDSIDLIQKDIKYLINQWFEQIILPPVFEVYFRYLHDNKSDYTDIIIPIFETFFKKQILPYSIVWKICLIGNPSHTEKIDGVIKSWWQGHKLTSHQENNRHFHKERLIYHHDTTIFNTLYDLGHSRFVNKLIKVKLKKIKDRAPDTLVPTNYGYLKFCKTIHGFSHKNIRFDSKNTWVGIINDIIWISSDKSATTHKYKLYHTGDKPDPKIYISLGIKPQGIEMIKIDWF